MVPKVGGSNPLSHPHKPRRTFGSSGFFRASLNSDQEFEKAGKSRTSLAVRQCILNAKCGPETIMDKSNRLLCRFKLQLPCKT